ncbi:hypothetical protein ACFL6S_09400 [Candidatus Poribacteria bacterium]
MFRIIRLALIHFAIVVLSYLLIGCGVRPQVDFYMNPVATGEEKQIDADIGFVVVEEAGVTITVSAVDTVDLLSITSDAHINPYIYVNDWGTARPRYTVFDVTIKNNRESEVQIEPANAVVMDESGEQYDAIPYEAFKERYGAYPRYERETIYRTSPGYYGRPYSYRYGRRRPWYYHYDYGYYWRGSPYYARRVYDPGYIKGAVLKGTMLRAVKLYPGGKRQGLMVFPLVAPDADNLKLIIPGITTYSEGKGKRVEFQFHFEQIPAIKSINDDKEDAGTG